MEEKDEQLPTIFLFWELVTHLMDDCEVFVFLYVGLQTLQRRLDEKDTLNSIYELKLQNFRIYSNYISDTML